MAMKYSCDAFDTFSEPFSSIIVINLNIRFDTSYSKTSFPIMHRGKRRIWKMQVHIRLRFKSIKIIIYQKYESEKLKIFKPKLDFQ